MGRDHWELTTKVQKMSSEAEAGGRLPFNRRDWILDVEEKSVVSGDLV